MKPLFVLALLLVVSPIFLWNRQAVAQENLQVLAFSTLQNAYGSRQNSARWNSDADLNNDSVINLSDLVLYCTTVPIFVELSDIHYHESINVTVNNANQSVLSYRYVTVLVPPNFTRVSENGTTYGSEWTNETMTKDGNHFSGYIDSASMPQGPYTTVCYNIIAMNAKYETEISRSYPNWEEP